ncbi:unnamed protein product [Umbelopsis ramanniana]
MKLDFFEKANLQRQLLLLIIFVLSIFGVGYQSIPIFTWILFPVTIYYSRSAWSNLLPLYIVNVFGNVLALLAVFNLDPTPGYADVGLLIGIAAAINILVIICYAIDHWAYNSKSSLLRIYTFPFLWAGAWNLLAWYSPLGDFFTFSQAGMIWNSFRQIASFGGRAMLDFLIAWFGTVVVETLIEGNEDRVQGLEYGYGECDDVVNKPTENEDSPRNDPEHAHERQPSKSKLRTIFSPLSIYCFIFALLLAYGGGQVSIIKGSFYQTSYANYITRDVVRAGCVIGNTDGTGYSLTDRQYWFDQTAQLANDGAKLVLWSEETYQTNDGLDEQQFLSQASSVASNHSIYLALSYINNIGDTFENLMTLIAPNGTVLRRYNKAHPVVGVEDQPAGPNVLQYVDTPDFGRIGLGICFDYNFPSLIDQAGQNQVDLMLQASWTWGPIGTFHARGNSLRAIENGFTMLRCGSQGMSGVFTATSDSPYQQQFATLSNQTLIFQLPRLPYTRTTYTVFRGAFGWICLAIGLLSLLYLIITSIVRKVSLRRS